MARFGVAAKAFAAIVLVLGFSLVLISLLNYFKYEKTFSGLQRSKFEVIARDLKAAAETGMNIGLPLPALKNMQDLIDRERHRDQQILSIDIFGMDGTVLYSTTPGRAGAKVSPKLLDALRHARGRVWELNDKDSFLVGVPINNNFGRVSGGLTIRYAKSYFDGELLRIGRELAEYSAIVFAISVFAAALAVLLLTRGVVTDGDANASSGAETASAEPGDELPAAERRAKVSVIEGTAETETLPDTDRQAGRQASSVADTNVVPLQAGKGKKHS